MSDRLEQARRRRQVVSFSRTLEPESALGYVVGVGPALFMLALLESMRFNGFQVFRIRDVRKLAAPHKHAAFVKAWMRLSGQSIPRKPRVSLASMTSLLRSASRAFPMVTIHREEVDPGVCHIGQVVTIDPKWLTLREVDPDAKWDARPSRYRVAEITRVDFGGGYEEALARVAGEQEDAPDEGRKEGIE